MDAATLTQIQERLRQLPPDQLTVVLDFVSYLADRQPQLSVGPPLVGWDEYEEDPEDLALAEEGMADYARGLAEYEERLDRGETVGL